MRLPLLLAASLCFAGLSQAASAEMIEKLSPHPVAITMDRLQAAIEGSGATVFARVDYVEGATEVKMELRPTQVMMFGNPMLGTPAVQDGQTVGLDLPLRVLAYEDAAGQTRVLYRTLDMLVAEHRLPADAEYLKKMAGALDNFTNAAIAAQ